MGKYTEEQAQFIRDNIKGTKYRVMAEMLNAKYGTDKTGTQIKHYCKRHGLKNGLTRECGQFKKGHSISNSVLREIGSERVGAYGQLMIKVSEDAEPYKTHRNWVMKKTYVWEQHNGPKPDDCTILNLDGNKMNCDISNLKLVTKNENIMMHRQKLVYPYPELTLTALNYIRLSRRRRECEKELKNK